MKTFCRANKRFLEVRAIVSTVNAPQLYVNKINIVFTSFQSKTMNVSLVFKISVFLCTKLAV